MMNVIVVTMSLKTAETVCMVFRMALRGEDLESGWRAIC